MFNPPQAAALAGPVYQRPGDCCPVARPTQPFYLFVEQRILLWSAQGGGRSGTAGEWTTQRRSILGRGRAGGKRAIGGGRGCGIRHSNKAHKKRFSSYFAERRFSRIADRDAARRLREPVGETRTSDAHEFFTILSFSSSERGIARRRPTSSFAEKRLRPRVRCGRPSVNPRHKGEKRERCLHEKKSTRPARRAPAPRLSACLFAAYEAGQAKNRPRGEARKKMTD